jgi:peptidoglycan/LPS O-acetylase OafA/YrhL
MMGSFRFLLAVMVVISHAHGGFAGYNIGIVAVISFFLISGYVMTVLVDRYYGTLSKIGLFYLDRSARLLPQYVVYLLLALSALALTRDSLLQSCGAYEFGLNLLIFPLDLYQLIDLKCMLIPQAWSLGLELSFYAVVPFLLVSQQFARWAALGSIAVFLLAFFGTIDNELYAYRLPPGTLFIFLVGVALARPDFFWRRMPAAIWLAALALFITLHRSEKLYAEPCNKEVIAGILIGIPALAILKRRSFSKWDELAGNLSYGLFLSHFIFIMVFRSIFNQDKFGPGGTVTILALATASALFSYQLVELPVIRWRHRLRSRHIAERATEIEAVA